MSADVWIISAPCATCGRSDADESAELNVTYNLSLMLHEAGFIGWRQIVDQPAPLVGKHVIGVLDGMALNPERWRAMNPENGWGDYDGCLQGRMRAWAEKCVAASDADLVGGSL